MVQIGNRVVGAIGFNADTGFEGDIGAAVRRAGAFQPPLNRSDAPFTIAAVGVRQQNPEFVSSQTADRVDVADRFSQNRRRAFDQASPAQ